MPRTTDEVKVESVVTHHKRLRQAFLLGKMDQRRDINSGVTSVIVSVVLAAVGCAGCVGFSFVKQALNSNRAAAVVMTASPGASGTASTSPGAPATTPRPATASPPANQSASSQPTTSPGPPNPTTSGG